MANYELFMQEMPYNKESHWRVSAKCADYPSEWFEVPDYTRNDISASKLREITRANFLKAEEICIECPVFFECGDSATDEDKMWTVRAGEHPTGPVYTGFCRSGKHKIEGLGRCQGCKSDRREESHERSRARRVSSVD